MCENTESRDSEQVMKEHELIALQDAIALESRQFLRKGRVEASLKTTQELRQAFVSPETLFGDGNSYIVRPISQEHNRLRELHSLDILDESGFRELDRLTAMAARIFHVQNAEVALVDLRRVWCPSRFGKTTHEFDREGSIASTAIAAPLLPRQVFRVLDASIDPRVSHLKSVKRKDGIRFYAGAKLIGPNGQCIGIFSIHSLIPREHDLSVEERETLSDLAATVMQFICSRREFHNIREEQKQAVTSLAHDLMTPLTGIQLSTELLRSDDATSSLNSKQKESLEALSTSVKVMERFCNGALDFLRRHEWCGDSCEDSETSETALDELISDLRTMIRFIPKKVPVIIKVDPAVPPLIRDGLKVQQAALNFLSIACARTVEGSIVFSVKVEGEQVIFECIDTAPALSESDAKHVMHFHDPRYFDDDIVARYACSVDASYLQAVGLKSGFARRTTCPGNIYWISVQNVKRRVSDYDSSTQLVSDEDGLTETDRSTLGGLRSALVVDDCPIVRKVLRRFLRKMGYEVDTAENGQEGLSKLMLETYDVCFCDFLMPILDGMDMVRQFRPWETSNRGVLHQQIIGMSAHAADNDSMKAIEAGMDSFLPKPISLVTLKSLVDQESAKRGRDKSASQENVMVLDDSLSSCGPAPHEKRYKSHILGSQPATTDGELNIIEDSDLTAYSSHGCLIISSDSADDCIVNAKAAFFQASWDLSHATTPEDALRRLKARNWDAVVVQRSISKMSGIDVIAEFRAWEVNNRFNRQDNVLFATASLTDDSITPSGFDGCFSIPSSLDELIQHVSHGERTAPMSIITH